MLPRRCTGSGVDAFPGMTKEQSDILFGVAVLIPFMVGVFALGWAINRFKNRRFVTAWRPLVPLIGGTVVEDGGGAATSWLTGRFEGHRVYASMIPDRNRSQDGGFKYHHFEAALQDVPGRVDWQVEYKAGLLGFGKESWQLQAEDPAVADRLLRAGVIELIRPLAEARAVPPALPTVKYLRRDATISYSEDSGTTWIPSPDRFREQLALLVRLAQLNADGNPK
jgi:hypothetical protein